MNDPLRVLDVNVTGTRNVLELSHRHGTRVVFSSTSEVFGKNPKPPLPRRRPRPRFDEDRALELQHQQGMAEHLVFAMHSAYGCR